MAKEYCKEHSDTELVEVTLRFCPKCRGSSGGLNAASAMTRKQRQARARKAIAARWSRKK